MKLNEDQNTIVKFASKGHNLLITGQAGVGKSEVVKTIIGTAKARGKKVAVICSSGIACQVYDRGEASTVHTTAFRLRSCLGGKLLIDLARTL